MAITLYNHNEETYNRILEKFQNSNRVGVVQPTGTGKSFLILKWIEDHPEDKFIILAPSVEIFTQLSEYAEAEEETLLCDVEMLTYQALNIKTNFNNIVTKRRIA